MPNEQEKYQQESAKLLSEVMKQLDVASNFEDPAILKNLYLLLKMWPSLTIYILEPYSAPRTQGGEEGRIYAEITTLKNGWKIHDYGYALSVSIGGSEDNHGTLSMGHFIEACKEMVKMLVAKGITKIAVDGLDVGIFTAWRECEEAGVEVVNFRPTIQQDQQRIRIQQVTKELERVREQLQL